MMTSFSHHFITPSSFNRVFFFSHLAALIDPPKEKNSGNKKTRVNLLAR